MDRRNFLKKTVIGTGVVIGIPWLGWEGYKKWFRPDRDLSEAQYHVYVFSKGIKGQRTIYSNIVDFQTGKPIATGSYQDQDKQEQEQLRFGENGDVFYKKTETNVKRSFNKKEETAKISSGIPTNGEYPNLWKIIKDNQYHYGGPKVIKVFSTKDGIDDLVCKIYNNREKLTGWTKGMKVTLDDDKAVLLHSHDSDKTNWLFNRESKEKVDVYNGSNQYYIVTDHGFFDVRYHGKSFFWDLLGVRLFDKDGRKAASIQIDDTWKYKQPVYVFRIWDEEVGRITRDENVKRFYRTETDDDGDSYEVEEKEKRETTNGFYMLEGTNPELCSMVLTLMAEKLQQLKFDYKKTWIDFGIDLLKLSQKPNEPEFALHLPLDVNLTPKWLGRSLERVLGYKPPYGFKNLVQ